MLFLLALGPYCTGIFAAMPGIDHDQQVALSRQGLGNFRRNAHRWLTEYQLQAMPPGVERADFAAHCRVGQVQHDTQVTGRGDATAYGCDGSAVQGKIVQ
ncbi:hypothetical protein D3C75_964810 [compost metagenome]